MRLNNIPSETESQVSKIRQVIDKASESLNAGDVVNMNTPVASMATEDEHSPQETEHTLQGQELTSAFNISGTNVNLLDAPTLCDALSINLARERDRRIRVEEELKHLSEQIEGQTAHFSEEKGKLTDMFNSRVTIECTILSTVILAFGVIPAMDFLTLDSSIKEMLKSGKTISTAMWGQALISTMLFLSSTIYPVKTLAETSLNDKLSELSKRDLFSLICSGAICALSSLLLATMWINIDTAVGCAITAALLSGGLIWRLFGISKQNLLRNTNEVPNRVNDEEKSDIEQEEEEVERLSQEVLALPHEQTDA